VGYNGVGFPPPTPGILTPETIPNCTQDLAGVRRLNIIGLVPMKIEDKVTNVSCIVSYTATPRI
jgi:hypothetical protein